MRRLAAVALLVAAASTDARADESIDEIVVLGEAVTSTTASIQVQGEIAFDTAQVLRRLPGAEVNTNGPLSGIAHYRGMFGDRVSISIDGLGVISGGPNAMDPPLTYVSPMITESLVLERGVPGVSSAPEAIGGHVEASLARGAFGTEPSLGLSGMAGARYSGNGDGTSAAARVTLSNTGHRVSAVAQSDRGNDLSTPVGRIVPSRLARDRYDLSYAFAGNSTDVLAFVGGLDTGDTGTPALAMDIRFIESDLYGLQLRRAITPTFTAAARLGYNAVDHLMDNFGLRTAPQTPMQYRQNFTTGSGSTFAFSGEWQRGKSMLKFGLDGRLARHTSRISNPNNAEFFINNFNDIERNVISAYSSIGRASALSTWEIGGRYVHVESNAGVVSAGGMSGMMGMQVAALADAFNAADRERRYDNLDLVLKYSRAVSDSLDLRLDLGSKTRAPSYQELYLWLPLQATGGLADGRNYTGNLDLHAERSNEVVLGLDWSGGRLLISPQAYYRRIEDYIQGVPSTVAPANMLATMMSGQGALAFENVEAEIYGVDMGWQVALSDAMSIGGAASYSRGRRTDVSDNLYRLPPPNANIAVNYSRRSMSVRTEVVAFAKQEKVSRFNDEQSTSGYAIVNALVSWQPLDSLRLELQVSNLLDRGYQDHLAGINRVRDVDIPVGERLWGVERTATFGAMLSF